MYAVSPVLLAPIRAFGPATRCSVEAYGEHDDDVLIIRKRLDHVIRPSSPPRSGPSPSGRDHKNGIQYTTHDPHESTHLFHVDDHEEPFSASDSQHHSAFSHLLSLRV